MNIGFNLGSAKEVVDTIKTQYKSLGDTTSSEWELVKKSLRTEWVGTDELSFEEQFIKKLNELYVAAYDVANTAGVNVAITAVNWVDFQHNNLLENATSGSNFEAGGEALETLRSWADNQSIEIEKIEALIEFSAEGVNLDASVNRGLQNESSAKTIQGAVETYVTNVKTNIEGLFKDIDTSKAFFGTSQSSALEAYLNAAGVALGVLQTAVADLHENVAKLAGSDSESGHYGKTDAEIAKNIDDKTTNMSESIENVSTRWTDSTGQ